MRPRAHSLLVLFAFICLAAGAPSVFTLGETEQVDSTEDLWIDMRLGRPLIPIFNQAARTDDIARVDHPSQAGQLSDIETGRRMVIFKSIPETEEWLPEIAEDIDLIGYNLEHSPATPEAEQADPVGSIQHMRDLADAYGLELAFGPDHDFALSHGLEIAPYVDIFVLQIQRQQTNPAVVHEFVEPLVPQLREANGDLEVSVQVRTEGDVGEIVALLDSLKTDLDGVSILTSPETVDVAEALVDRLRPSSGLAVLGEGSGERVVLLLLILLSLGFVVFLLSKRPQPGG